MPKRHCGGVCRRSVHCRTACRADRPTYCRAWPRPSGSRAVKPRAPERVTTQCAAANPTHTNEPINTMQNHAAPSCKHARPPLPLTSQAMQVQHSALWPHNTRADCRLPCALTHSCRASPFHTCHTTWAPRAKAVKAFVCQRTHGRSHSKAFEATVESGFSAAPRREGLRRALRTRGPVCKIGYHRGKATSHNLRQVVAKQHYHCSVAATIHGAPTIVQYCSTIR